MKIDMTESVIENQPITLSDERLELLSQELKLLEKEFLDKITELEKLLDLIDE